MNFTSPETRIIVLPDTEDRMIVCSFLHSHYRFLTEVAQVPLDNALVPG